MSVVKARVMENKEGVDVFGVIANGFGAPEVNKKIPDQSEQIQQGKGDFTLDNEKMLRIGLYNGGNRIDLDVVQNLVSIQLKWPKGLDVTVTQTGKGWEVKMEPTDNPVDPNVTTSISVGVGEPGNG